VRKEWPSAADFEGRFRPQDGAAACVRRGRNREILRQKHLPKFRCEDFRRKNSSEIPEARRKDSCRAEKFARELNFSHEKAFLVAQLACKSGEEAVRRNLFLGELPSLE
jgi:hypothetical protein